MDLLVFLAVIIFFVWFMKIGFSKKSTSQRAQQVYPPYKINKHGHRCYVEGLSVAEREVVLKLSQGLDCKEYFIYNNLILPTSFGNSTQIDHLVVSKYGIFVIESKNYNGWIFGNSDSVVWTQSFARGKKFTFNNPLRQNYAHVAALETLIPFVKGYLYNIVVFSDSCEFKTPRINNVVYLSELVQKIKEYQVVKLDDEHLYMAIGKLAYLCQAIDITADEHVSNVRNYLDQKGSV